MLPPMESMLPLGNCPLAYLVLAAVTADAQAHATASEAAVLLNGILGSNASNVDTRVTRDGQRAIAT